MDDEFDYGSSDDEPVASESGDDPQDTSECSDSDGESVDSSFDEKSWTSKDGTIWSPMPLKNNTGRKRSHDILLNRPGVTSYATSRVRNEVDAFKVSFDTKLISLVIDHTNQKGQESLDEQWRIIDEIEFDAFLGLLVLAAIFKSNKESLETLWHEDLGRPIFRATMSLQRFKTIFRMLRTDDKSTRSSEKGAAIAEFWNLWNFQQSLLMSPHQDVTIDEQLVAFRGRIFCRQYMPNKPAKYGLKFFNACDSLTGFVLHSQLYLGKRDGKVEKNQSQRVSEDLLLNRNFEGRTATMDNWFTSAPLAQKLLKNNIGMVGTLKNNRTCIPPALLSTKDRQLFSSKFAHTSDTTLVSYIARKGKNLLLLSTVHHDQEVTNTPKKKPEIVMHYNRNKGAVDTVDRRIASYSVKRATRNWKIVIISNGIDLSLNNAFIVYDTVCDGWSTALYRKRLFMEQLGTKLVHEHIVQRERVPRSKVSAEIVRATRKRNTLDAPGPSKQLTVSNESSEGSSVSKKRGRCSFCEKSDNKHSTTCSICMKYTCKHHGKIVCPKCQP